jgi:YidC/Oxa1 family membrane protein insertase
MDRNTIAGLLLIIAIIIGYSLWTSPSKEETARRQRLRDSIAEVGRAEQARLLEAMRSAGEQGQTPALDAASGDSLRKRELNDRFGVFSSSADGENSFVTMENEVMKVRFSTRGGRPYSVELKNYKRYDGSPLILFDGDSTVFGFRFFAQNRNIATSNLYFEPLTGGGRHILAQGDSATLVMRLNAGENAYIEYRYTMKPNDYMMGFDASLSNIDRLLTGSRNAVDFEWQAYSPRQEKGAQNENQYTSLFYKYFQGDAEELSSSKDDRKLVSTRLDWIVFKQQFFSCGLMARQSFANAELKSYKLADQTRFIKRYEALAGVELKAGQAATNVGMSLYFGPNHYRTLKKYDAGLEHLVPLGKNIIRWINRLVIIPLFDWLGSFIGSYGLIILLMTIVIKLGLLPLTFRSYMSSARMRVLKPQIDEINARIPKEKAMERQQAVMALYKRAGVSPMGGCLPMLLQMPILLAMFRFFPASIELRQQSFLWASDLSTYDSILEWSAQIPLLSTFYGNHISLFTLLMTAATIVSMKMSSGQTDSSAMPGMKTMMYIMPVMFMFFLNNYSAGLTYYYFLANVITIAQNEIFKRSIDEAAILAKLQANKSKPSKKSAFQQRLEKMQRQQQALAQARRKAGKK